ncbi:FAD-binding oxidoreductase [Yinghuangia aomiensis]
MLPGAVAARASDRLAAAHDASHYLIVPQAVVRPRDVPHMAALFRATAAHGVAVTFRSGGTSLSGQAGGAEVLVDTRRHFRGIEVLDDGARVRVEPGATVRAVNTRLRPVRPEARPRPGQPRRPAPSAGSSPTTPAAWPAAPRTARTARSVGRPRPAERHRRGHRRAGRRRPPPRVEPAVRAGLVRLPRRVRANPSSLATIRRLYALENIMGYGVNSFVDHTRPVDILAHLVIGSEGTLAFVAEPLLRTVPSHPHTATGLLLFDDLTAATAALPDLVAAGFAAVELLDDKPARRTTRRRPPTICAASTSRTHAAGVIKGFPEF